jgi:hypothetical protein
MGLCIGMYVDELAAMERKRGTAASRMGDCSALQLGLIDWV